MVFLFVPNTNNALPVMIPKPWVGPKKKKIQLQGTLYTCCEKVISSNIRKMIHYSVALSHKWQDVDIFLVIFPENNRRRRWIMQLMSDLYSGCLNWMPYKFLFHSVHCKRILGGCSWLRSVILFCCRPGLRSDWPPAHQREEWVSPYQWCSGCGGSVHPGALWEGEYHRTPERMCGQH